MNVRRLSSILVVFLALRADPASPQQSAGITKEEFDRLPSSALFDVGGRKVTKGEVLARLQQAKSGPVAGQGSLNLRALNAELARKTALAVSADNAKVHAMKPQSTRLVRRCAIPKIEAIFRVPPVEPGEEFFIKGCGFEKEGKARLEFNEKSADLTAVEWNDQYIHVQVPESLEGVADQEGVVLKVYLRERCRSRGGRSSSGLAGHSTSCGRKTYRWIVAGNPTTAVTRARLRLGPGAVRPYTAVTGRRASALESITSTCHN